MSDRPSPEDDPFACDICGHYLSSMKRLRGDLCDSCQKEHQTDPNMATCVGCGQYAKTEKMEAVDVSRPDEHYPKVEYVCWRCSRGGAGD